MAFTRVTCDEVEHGMMNPLPREDAFIFCLQLRGYYNLELWLDGRHVPMPASPSRSFSFFDLNRQPVVNLRDPFDSLHFYVPRAALDAVAAEEGRTLGEIQLETGAALEDPIVWHIGAALLPALERPEQFDQLFLEHVAVGTIAHLAQRYGAPSKTDAERFRGGLSPRQERRVKELLMSRLDGAMSLEEIARECGVSRSHLARAFKRSTGQTAHRWLLARRIERACELLRDARLPLAEISTRCGFADQSHFTRVLRSALGESPGKWRRENIAALGHRPVGRPALGAAQLEAAGAARR
jgi:AraC-like DNA-binding protein